MNSVAKRRTLVTSNTVQGSKQHTKPCSDCPWRRDSVQGWLGGFTAKSWVNCAHSETVVKCHVIRNQQCAGTAIYRANVYKLPRTPEALQLPPDTGKVFSSIIGDDFLEHHGLSDTEIDDFYEDDE